MSPLARKLRNRVFISHASADQAFSKVLSDALTGHGFHVWFDGYELSAGQSIVEQINDGLSSCDFLVLVASHSAMNSGWVTREWAAAIYKEINERRNIVIPVKIDDCEIPVIFGDKLFADFRGGFSEGLLQLLHALRAPVDASSGNGGARIKEVTVLRNDKDSTVALDIALQNSGGTPIWISSTELNLDYRYLVQGASPFIRRAVFHVEFDGQFTLCHPDNSIEIRGGVRAGDDLSFRESFRGQLATALQTSGESYITCGLILPTRFFLPPMAVIALRLVFPEPVKTERSRYSRGHISMYVKHESIVSMNIKLKTFDGELIEGRGDALPLLEQLLNRGRTVHRGLIRRLLRKVLSN